MMERTEQSPGGTFISSVDPRDIGRGAEASRAPSVPASFAEPSMSHASAGPTVSDEDAELRRESESADARHATERLEAADARYATARRDADDGAMSARRDADVGAYGPPPGRGPSPQDGIMDEMTIKHNEAMVSMKSIGQRTKDRVSFGTYMKDAKQENFDLNNKHIENFRKEYSKLMDQRIKALQNRGSRIPAEHIAGLAKLKELDKKMQELTKNSLKTTEKLMHRNEYYDKYKGQPMSYMLGLTTSEKHNIELADSGEESLVTHEIIDDKEFWGSTFESQSNEWKSLFPDIHIKLHVIVHDAITSTASISKSTPLIRFFDYAQKLLKFPTEPVMMIAPPEKETPIKGPFKFKEIKDKIDVVINDKKQYQFEEHAFFMNYAQTNVPEKFKNVLGYGINDKTKEFTMGEILSFGSSLLPLFCAEDYLNKKDNKASTKTVFNILTDLEAKPQMLMFTRHFSLDMSNKISVINMMDQIRTPVKEVERLITKRDKGLGYLGMMKAPILSESRDAYSKALEIMVKATISIIQTYLNVCSYSEKKPIINLSHWGCGTDSKAGWGLKVMFALQIFAIKVAISEHTDEKIKVKVVYNAHDTETKRLLLKFLGEIKEEEITTIDNIIDHLKTKCGTVWVRGWVNGMKSAAAAGLIGSTAGVMLHARNKNREASRTRLNRIEEVIKKGMKPKNGSPAARLAEAVKIKPGKKNMF